MKNELYNFCKENYNGTIIQNDSSTLEKDAIDIYFPELNMAIDMMSLFWDTDTNGKGKYYFIEKLNKCKEKGIQLITLYEDEWNNCQNIIKSMILHKLKKSGTTIYARQCVVKRIENKKQKKDFINDSHLQGSVGSTYDYGLYTKKDNELVSVLTFGVPRYNKNVSHEIIRFCNKRGCNVVGAFTKLLKVFIEEINPEKIITYADVRHSTGNLYRTNGFTQTNIADPNYFYCIEDCTRRVSRVMYQKHKLKNKLTIFDDKRTEWQNMCDNQIDRVFDCGNFVFIMDRTEEIKKQKENE